jgi:hypothetical protein
MASCPTCEAEVAVLITNVKTGRQHCHGCVGGTFMPWYVLTLEDVRWMRECGIDPEITAIEGCIKLGQTTKKAIHFGHARYA